jgi:hypothetical protein
MQRHVSRSLRRMTFFNANSSMNLKGHASVNVVMKDAKVCGSALRTSACPGSMACLRERCPVVDAKDMCMSICCDRGVARGGVHLSVAASSAAVISHLTTRPPRCVQGLPVREVLQTLFTIYRDKMIKEAIVFLVYFAIFLFISWQVRRHLSSRLRWPARFHSGRRVVLQVFNVQQAYTTNAALENLLIDEAFPECVAGAAACA